MFLKRNRKNNISIVVAHGESKEVAASRAVSDMIEKILLEHHNDMVRVQSHGTFQLQYTPIDTNQKSYAVPLTTLYDSQLNMNAESNGQPISSVTKIDDIQYNPHLYNTVNSRH
jgi:hypothetical protein